MTQLEQTFFESATRWFRKPEPVDIDWEQRRYEIARAAMQGYITLDMGDFANCTDGGKYGIGAADFAVKCADALIEELKK